MSKVMVGGRMFIHCDEERGQLEISEINPDYMTKWKPQECNDRIRYVLLACSLQFIVVLLKMKRDGKLKTEFSVFMTFGMTKPLPQKLNEPQLAKLIANRQKVISGAAVPVKRVITRSYPIFLDRRLVRVERLRRRNPDRK